MGWSKTVVTHAHDENWTTNENRTGQVVGAGGTAIDDELRTVRYGPTPVRVYSVLKNKPEFRIIVTQITSIAPIHHSKVSENNSCYYKLQEVIPINNNDR